MVRKKMKKKIISMFLCILIIETIMPYAAVASKIDTEKNIMNNNSPPNEPTIIAPEKVQKGKWFEVKFIASDPDGDDIYYRYKFDVDNTPSMWYGPFSSGTERSNLVNVVPATTITIQAQAKDVHDAESDWSSVNIPVCRSRAITWQFLRFLEAYPNIFSLLKTRMSL